MKIVAFGDSFIHPSHHSEFEKKFINHSDFTDCYEGILARYYNTVPEFLGIPGSGPWHAFMNFYNYMSKVKKHPDVVLFAWSEPYARLYHKKYIINTHYAFNEKNKSDWDQEKIDTMDAAADYYTYLFDKQKMTYDMQALMLYFDEITKKYPDTKFVNMHCWDRIDDMFTNGWHNHYRKTRLQNLKYYHNFKNCAEIRPSLMYLSMLDDCPDNLMKDHRICHLSKGMHVVLGKALKEAINDYAPGKVVQVELGWYEGIK